MENMNNTIIDTAEDIITSTPVEDVVEDVVKSSGWEKFGKAGAVVLVGYGIYKIGKWAYGKHKDHKESKYATPKRDEDKTACDEVLEGEVVDAEDDMK